MEFEFDDNLSAVRDLGESIFSAKSTVDRLREVEKSGGFDAELWKVLADSDLLGIALPEEAGGAGLGMLGLAAVLEQQGRRVAQVPLWSVVATAALPIAEFGSPEQKASWLPGLLDGSVIVAGAFETGHGADLPVRAEASGDGWTLYGTVESVAAADVAVALVVPVGMPGGGTSVMIVPAERLVRTTLNVTNHESNSAVSFDGAVVTAADVLPGDGTAIFDWTLRRARVALAALAVGVCEEALAMTAKYTSERIQFGRPISTNQAVSVRAADAYLDTESIRLTAQRAAWLMDTGAEGEAEAAALVAKWWASRGGLRVVHATQHLHGGIGADIDYPIHRYFLWGRQIAFSLGSAGAVGMELANVLEKGASIGAPV
ncbi:acyl-CoA dehydrogenase family protein [Rhodococcus sp. OK302]|uniref:acyl-CoA dehydrogenase family protein n=1 Tax=Rhodococcus sp. OK302 TaxID=1882769 RepID=UPI000B940F27|nr:acyl-CoA dehydrogenase family protein [Rhodococcus sp. OK302]OYD67717.1 alkylation response protein AidB-like acyl-CoA dehydrogenase [Rhodococcus sp. OK302]